MECPRIFRRFLVGFPYEGSEIRAEIRVEARKNHVSFFSSFASAGPKFVRPLIQKRVGQFYKRRRGKACEARARRNAHRFLLRTFRGRISALFSTFWALLLGSPILPALPSAVLRQNRDKERGTLQRHRSGLLPHGSGAMYRRKSLAYHDVFKMKNNAKLINFYSSQIASRRNHFVLRSTFLYSRY